MLLMAWSHFTLLFEGSAAHNYCNRYLVGKSPRTFWEIWYLSVGSSSMSSKPVAQSASLGENHLSQNLLVFIGFVGWLIFYQNWFLLLKCHRVRHSKIGATTSEFPESSSWNVHANCIKACNQYLACTAAIYASIISRETKANMCTARSNSMEVCD